MYLFNEEMLSGGNILKSGDGNNNIGRPSSHQDNEKMVYLFNVVMMSGGNTIGRHSSG